MPLIAAVVGSQFVLPGVVTVEAGMTPWKKPTP